MPKIFNYRRNRKNPLESGLYFLFLDYHNKVANPELSQILRDYDLFLHVSKTDKSGREAFFLNFKDRSGCHLTIDCKYYQEYSDINQLMKWHYCHYTDASSAHEIIHVYFNTLGQIVLCSVTDKITGVSRDVYKDALIDIALDIEVASRIIQDLLALKNITVNKAKTQSESIFAEAYSFINGQSALTDFEDVLNEKLAQYLHSTEIARRYADVYLYFPITMLETVLQNAKNACLKQQQVQQLEDEAEEQPTEQLEVAASPSNVTTTKAIDVSLPKKAQQAFKSLLAEVQDLHRLKDTELFAKIYRLDQITYEVMELLPKLKPSDKTLALHLLESLSSFEITKHVNKLLNPRTVTLETLKQNFKLIEPYIEERFFSNMVTMAVLSKDSQTINSYVAMCDFLYGHSSAYITFIKDAQLLKAESKTPFSVSSLELCFNLNNPVAFEMLLRHGVSLGATCQTAGAAEDNFNISVFKHLLKHFTLKLAGHEIGNSQAMFDQITQKIVTFLNIMFHPMFKAGFEYENSLHARIKKKVLKARCHETIKVLSFAQRNGGVYKVARKDDSSLDKPGFFSILDHALRFNLPSVIIEVVARNIKPSDINLRSLAKYFAQFLTDNRFAIVVNDNNNHSVKTICSAVDVKIDSYVTERLLSTSDPALIDPCIYILPHENNHEDIHTVNSLNIIRDLTVAKIAVTPYKELQDLVNWFLTREKNPELNDRLSRQDMLTNYFGALLILINSKPNNKNFAWHYAALTELFLKLADGHMEQKKYGAAITLSYFFHAHAMYSASKHLEDKHLKQRIEAIAGFQPSLLSEIAQRFLKHIRREYGQPQLSMV
jgi:hypothetical protein